MTFNINTFFSRKTASGDGLTDALTIGGVIAGIFVSPVALLAVGASEIIKIANKQSMDSEYKETLKLKIDEIIDKNKNELLSQAEIRFNKVADEFKAEIMKLYDELLISIRKAISDEEVILTQGKEILAKINSLI